MMTARRAWSILALLAAARGAAAGGIVHVDDDAPPGGDGSSWAAAFTYLHDALGLAGDPGNGVTEIRVAQGTYLPDRSALTPGGSGDRAASFVLVGGTALRGGYAGLGAPAPDARDPALYETVLSGDLAGDDQPGFVNSADNSYHVVRADDAPPSTVIDGFTLTGGNAGGTGGGLQQAGGELTVEACAFRANAASAPPGNPALAGGALACLDGVLTLSGCVFEDNFGDIHGGAVALLESETLLTGCSFVGNAGIIGGAIRLQGGSLTAVGCSFQDNTAAAGAAMFAYQGGSLKLIDCAFVANKAELSMGAVGGGMDQWEIVNSSFFQNDATDIGGGAELVGDTLEIVNCAFSRNSATFGGGLFIDGTSTITSCTVGNNGTTGLGVGPLGLATLSNVIIWGNGTAIGPDPGGSIGPVSISHSDIEGGWEGDGNIDADPLFVQPGADNLRLSNGSPCADAGDDSALPPDEHDLDGDGNVAEPLPVDLDGEARIQGAAVDMGAYEGEDEPLPPAETVDGLGQGELAVLVPQGGGFNPLEQTMVTVMNVSGPDNASFAATETSSVLHPGAGGYSELASIVITETSLADGDFLAIVSLPFGAADLGDVDPAEVNATFFDAENGNWALAVAGNTVPSPGFSGPIGERTVIVGGGEYGVALEPGRYGVYWDPALQQGFVWATVDRAGDFGLGVPLCAADCRQTPDGRVGVEDFLALLAGWGRDGPCDVDGSLLVDAADLAGLLLSWGACGPSAPAAAAAPPRVRPQDLDGDGRIGAGDLDVVETSWGPCPGCPADLDGDGIVSARDQVQLLAGWGRSVR